MVSTNMNMWWPITKHLNDFLLARPEFCDLDYPIMVQMGATRQDPSKLPAVLILRNKEGNLDFHRRRQGTVFLWLEFWVSNASTDPSVAYELLSVLEETTVSTLHDWVKAMVPDLGIACVVTIPAWRGDGDTIRPKCISQLTLQIDWKR